MRDLKHLHRLVDRAVSQRDHHARVVEEESCSLTKAQDSLSDAQEGLSLVQNLAQGVQNTVHSRIASIVTRCIQAVYPDEGISFDIIFEKKRSRTEAKLVFTRDGMDMSPVDACGGGVIDVAALALRLTSLLLCKPSKRKLLVLDEPCKHVSSEYRPAVRHLLESLSREMGIQIIMSTHSKELVCGKVVEID